MKKKITKILKYFFTIIIAAFLVTIGINAADHYGNISESVVYRAIFGEEKSICPSDMVMVSTEKKNFCLDKYENAPGKKCPIANPNNGEQTRSNLDVLECGPISEQGKIPWTNISLDQAANACAKAGKRLPTLEEWYQGSLGTPDPKNNLGADNCQLANNWTSQPGLSGSGKNCLSGVGAYDMIGNVWEWVSGQVYDGNYNGRTLPEQGYIISIDRDTLPLETSTDNPSVNYNEDYFWVKKNGYRAMARGGYWDNKADGGLNSVYLVSAVTSSGNGIGFRCVK